MKKLRKKKEFLEQVRRIPIVQVACEKVDLSRNTVYRWRKEDAVFATNMDEALAEGEELVNDMSESQLLALIKDKHFGAIRLWLNHRNPKFKEKVEVTATHKIQKEMTDEGVELARKALSLHTLNLDRYDATE
jgi:hypothetical protein